MFAQWWAMSDAAADDDDDDDDDARDHVTFLDDDATFAAQS